MFPCGLHKPLCQLELVSFALYIHRYSSAGETGQPHLTLLVSWVCFESRSTERDRSAAAVLMKICYVQKLTVE